MNYYKTKYDEWVKNGICVSCRKPTSGRVKCNACLEKRKQLEKARAEAGVCVKCGRHPADKNKKLCEDCLTKNKKFMQKRNSRYKQKGICNKCGQKKVVKNKNTCKDCMEKTKIKSRQRRAERKNQGICYICSHPATKGNYCDKHAVKAYNARIAKKTRRREAGKVKRRLSGK